MFEESKKNPELRQNFLDSLELENLSTYVNSLTYYDSIKEFEMETITRSNEDLLMGTKGTKSEIKVYPPSFLWFVGSTQENFLSTLEHEIRHAKQTYSHPEKYFPQISILDSKKYSIEQKKDYINQKIILGEIDAYENQLADIMSGKRKVTYDLKNCVIENLKAYYAKLSQQKLL